MKKILFAGLMAFFLTPVYAGNDNSNGSCQGNCSGAFGFTWVSSDCKQVVAGQNMAAIGETKMACEIWKQTDGFKRAAKRNPAIAEMACK